MTENCPTPYPLRHVAKGVPDTFYSLKSGGTSTGDSAIKSRSYNADVVIDGKLF
jgi:hypothetical protein